MFKPFKSSFKLNNDGKLRYHESEYLDQRQLTSAKQVIQTQIPLRQTQSNGYLIRKNAAKTPYYQILACDLNMAIKDNQRWYPLINPITNQLNTNIKPMLTKYYWQFYALPLKGKRKQQFETILHPTVTKLDAMAQFQLKITHRIISRLYENQITNHTWSLNQANQILQTLINRLDQDDRTKPLMQWYFQQYLAYLKFNGFGPKHAFKHTLIKSHTIGYVDRQPPYHWHPCKNYEHLAETTPLEFDLTHQWFNPQQQLWINHYFKSYQLSFKFKSN